MFGHRIEQLVVARIGQVEGGVERLAFTHRLPHLDPGSADHVYQLVTRRRCRQILHDLGLDTAVAQQLQGLT